MSSTVSSIVRFGFSRRGVLAVVAVGLIAATAAWSERAVAQAKKQAAPKETQAPTQVQLTPKHIESFIAAFKPLTPLFEKLQSGAKPDPNLMAAIENTAKKYGFSSIDEYDAVANSISAVLSGIDPKTKQYSDPIPLIKKEIAEVMADKSISAAERKKILAELNAELAEAQPVRYPSNIQLVLKYFDRLNAILPQQDPQGGAPPPPAGKKK